MLILLILLSFVQIGHIIIPFYVALSYQWRGPLLFACLAQVCVCLYCSSAPRSIQYTLPSLAGLLVVVLGDLAGVDIPEYNFMSTHLFQRLGLQDHRQDSRNQVEVPI